MDQPRVEKRNRPPKSCEPCRQRKLRCNRGLPCDTCVGRGKQLICRYAPNADRSPTQQKDSDTIRDRLQNMENIIFSLMENSSSTIPSPGTGLRSKNNLGSNSTKEIEDDRQSLSTRPVPALVGASPYKGQVSYVDTTHWSSILADIKGIREHLSPYTDQDSTTTSVASSWMLEDSPLGKNGIILGSAESLSMDNILAAIPPREVCNSLISRYFHSRYTIFPILHPVKFQLEYESFWEAPTETSPVWVGLLFAMLSLSASIYELSAMKPSSEYCTPSAKDLSKRTEQCLVLGRYATADEYALEALMIHLQSCYLRAKDSNVNFWFLICSIMSLAVRLGYHRDPTRLSGAVLTPFEGEMRRRLWVSIYQIDALISFQMGLPSLVPSEFCDTQLPHNLEYSDFDPNISALPPSLPLSTNTSIQYTIVKAPVIATFKSIVKHTRSLIPTTYEQSTALDARARAVYSNLPSSFKYHALKRSFIDGPELIMKRTTIELLYLKSIIILHRRYILLYRQNTDFSPSRSAVLASALAILDRQAELCEATQPGGHLYDEHWMFSVLTMNDFLLAAMVICLELTIRVREVAVSCGRERSLTTSDGFDTEKLLAALRTSHQNWMAASSSSVEARIASQTIEFTIQKLNDSSILTDSSSIDDNFHHLKGPMAVDDTASYTADADGQFEPIDWGVFDNPYQGLAGDLDLDSWFQDTVESLNANDSTST